MPWQEFQNSKSLQVYALGYNGSAFCSLIMAAMREANTRDSYRLRYAFPEIWSDLCLRIKCPGGVLEGEGVLSDDQVQA